MGTLKTRVASKRRIASTLALGAGVAALSCGAASAQPTETTVLPEIAVTNTRLVGGAGAGRRGVAPGTGTDAGTDAPADSAGASGIVTGTIITGASSTVITAQEIERSPGQTVQDVLAREPLNFAAGSRTGESAIELPAELRRHLVEGAGEHLREGAGPMAAVTGFGSDRSDAALDEANAPAGSGPPIAPGSVSKIESTGC